MYNQYWRHLEDQAKYSLSFHFLCCLSCMLSRRSIQVKQVCLCGIAECSRRKNELSEHRPKARGNSGRAKGGCDTQPKSLACPLSTDPRFQLPFSGKILYRGVMDPCAPRSSWDNHVSHVKAPSKTTVADHVRKDCVNIPISCKKASVKFQGPFPPRLVVL
jgi:hypothetical protein